MFDPLDMPGNYGEEYSSSSETSTEQPSSTKKYLSDEEIALRIVEMFVSNSKVSSVESVVDHYFFVLNKLKNKGEITTSYSEPSYDSYAPTLSENADEKDMISNREFISDAEADDINQMFD